ncbi:MAG: radical SAM family heme chaperone HemW [Myxococcota bacterium]
MDDVGVYVHVPFCERVCPYCDFAVVGAPTLPRERQRGYVDTLLRELHRRRGDFAGRRLATLYLGGGTPSLLHPDEIARLVAAVRDAFPGEPRETTLELNPGTTAREHLAGFRAAGVDRVSVGAQSFDDTRLRRLGRAHDAAEVRRSLAACREAFPRLSLDLIVAAPGQTREELARDLDAALEHAPDHVSAYELTLEPGTPFARAAAAGRLAKPAEEECVALLRQAEARLAGAGLARYEISSYARPGCEAVHNRRYWERRPVLGLGMGAVSTDPPTPDHPHGVRRHNPRVLERWQAAVEQGAPPPSEPLGPAVARGEAVFLSLRTVRGLDAARFAREFGAPPRHFFGRQIDALVAGGLLEEGPEGGLRLTDRGRLLSDGVFEEFV